MGVGDIGGGVMPGTGPPAIRTGSGAPAAIQGGRRPVPALT